MKPLLEDIPFEKGSSTFYASHFHVPFFEFKWHYHPEYELTYILKGNGYRIVGNSYEQFTEGDFVLLGTNLPHTWSSKLPSEAIVIQFSKEFISPFLGLQEGQMIKDLLESSARGIRFQADEIMSATMIDLAKSAGIERIMKLISILDILSKKPTSYIAPNTFHTISSKKSEMRINTVCVYIQHHFYKKLSLKEIADLIGLTESNFCKFFKKATGKTYSNYVNEIRINEACRMLVQTDKTIVQISFECGFETLSYFNRIFLKKMHMTPSTFKKEDKNGPKSTSQKALL
jgi:AraC-like DNA-binding protein